MDPATSLGCEQTKRVNRPRNELGMNYQEMLKHAAMSCKEFAKDNRCSVYQLTWEDRAIIGNLMVGGGVVYDKEGPLQEWYPNQRWSHQEYFLTVIPHNGIRRHIPLPWVTPWNRVERRKWEAWSKRRKVEIFIDQEW